MITYSYDPLGRRLSKCTQEGDSTQKEYYLYHGMNEIGVYDEANQKKSLRVLGKGMFEDALMSVAIETQNEIFAPIYDPSCNILHLINADTKEVLDYSKLQPFGENLATFKFCPWVFSMKLYDRDTGLIFYGHCYYDPTLRQWMTPDPVKSGDDPYLFVGNNPLKNIDPDGRSFLKVVIPLVGVGSIISAPAIAPMVVTVASGIGTGYAIHYIGKKVHKAYKSYKKENSRNPNKLTPIEGAYEEHSTFRRDPDTGKVTNYETYDKNPKTGALGSKKRFRGEGKTHGDIEPPLVLERPAGKGPGSRPNVPRKPKPDEIPKGKK